MARKGLLATFEGIDGSGKTTVVRAVADALRKAGADVVETVEPTTTWLGDAVKRALHEPLDPVAEALLFGADHAGHVARLRGLLGSPRIVLSDRYNDSCFAYQGAALAGRVPDPISWLRSLQRPFDLPPDLTLLLDVDPKAAVARLAGRPGKARFEREEFLGKVRANYLWLAKEEPGRFVVLDASRGRDAVAAEASERVLALARSRRLLKA